MSFATFAFRTLMLALLAGFSLPLAAQTQTPFGGTPIPLPGTFEAENFDNGGEGVAYHDNVAGNAGNQYRTGESVDIIVSGDSAGGGFVVNNFDAGEWLEYTVDIAAAGQYEIAIRASNNWTTSPVKFHVEIDNVDRTGSVTVPVTGSWNTFTWVAKAGVSLPAGVHVLKLVSDAPWFNVNQIRVTSTPTTPFAGVIALPGIFEAENFDNGGEGLAYHDNVAGNASGQYRTTESVDIKVSGDPSGGGFVVNNFDTGEWLLYTVSVATTGLYDIDLRAATGATTTAKFHIEIDGVNLTGSVAVPPTGSFGTYAWIGKRTVQLTAGQHVLKLFSDEQWIDVNQIRVAAVTHTPFGGTPISLPGTFEAENFDLGGEGNAYHDTDAINDGGSAFRTSEGVDIKPSPDPDGGTYVINNFQTGEWVVYTVNVAQTGNYDIDLRASTGSFTNSAYHLEIDGTNVTGTVVLPSTGNFGTYQWIGKKTVQLTAGLHVLKLFSDQQFVDVNQIRVVASTGPVQPPATMIFWSGFDGISLSPIVSDSQCDQTNCNQDLVGTDSVTGFAWPPQGPALSNSRFKLRAGGGSQVNFFTNPKPGTIANWIVNRIETVTGRTGGSTQAQYSEIKQNCFGHTGSGQEDCSTQDTYQGGGTPAEDTNELYISFWRKVQPDLAEKMASEPEKMHVVFEWKTTGDKRVIAEIVGWDAGQPPYFQIRLDNVANGGLTQHEDWRCPNFGLTVCGAPKVRVPPLDQWFKFEVYWRRGTGSDGRIWMAVNGVKIVDNHGPNYGVNNNPIDRIMFLQLYSGLNYPLYQWTDDVQIWSTFPSAAPGDPWYDGVYGPH